MNKKVFGRKLSRSRPSREALFVSLARAMVSNGKIVTTRAKAKAVLGNLEKFVTLAKKGDLNSRRRALSKLDNSRDTVEKLFSVIAPAFSAKTSGFVRLISLPTRKGDNAKMVRMEWTEKITNGEELKSKSEKISKKVKVEKKVIKK